MDKALAYNRKTGETFWCRFNVESPYIVLYNPIKRCRTFQDTIKFIKGYTRKIAINRYYGESCRTMMVPCLHIRLEILKEDEKIDWATLTLKDAEKLLSEEQEKDKVIYEKEKLEYFNNRRSFRFFFSRLFKSGSKLL